MPSTALNTWQTDCSDKLDEIVAAHTAVVGGQTPGRKYATLQINQAYAMMLASQFQRFCRDLHSEAVDHLCAHVPSPWARQLLRTELTSRRQLDRGNANPGTIGADFNRLGLQFWPEVQAAHHHNEGRQAKLQLLNKWRNAIAHQDFTDVPGLDVAGRKNLRLEDVKSWRKACGLLAVSFDSVVGTFVEGLVGHPPW